MKYLVPLAALLTACATLVPVLPPSCPPQRVALWIDPSFTLEDQLQIEAAAQQWNFALNGYLRFGDTGSEVVHVKYAAERDVSPDFSPLILGWDERIGSREITLVPSRIHDRGHNLEGVALHELGHYLGLAHDMRSGTLMSTPIDQSVDCVDDRTLARVARLQRWDVEHMNRTCR